MPVTPDGLVSESTFISYEYNGVEKVAAWLPLSNGMRLVVSTPVSEAEGDWQKLVWNILIVAAEVLVVSSVFTLWYTKRLSRPLKELTKAAQQFNDGNYNYVLTYENDDEIGILTKTFKSLANNVRAHISDLNSKVFVYALTSVRNKAAYNAECEKLQKQIEENPSNLKFAIGIFDCNNLKIINDQYGHDKGDIYLKRASEAIGRAFKGCPVFRIGGDEFAVILMDENYQNREILINRFDETRFRMNNEADNKWEMVNIAMGFAEFDYQDDHTVEDVSRRADRRMYENKASK